MKFKGIITSFKKVCIDHSPEILVGVGIAGLCTSVVLGIVATPKAMHLIEEKKEELEVDKLSKVDVLKTTWKCYIPTASTMILSVACILTSNGQHLKRNAAVAAAYHLSEATLLRYKDKVVETLGEKKEKKIREEIAADSIKEMPASQNVILMTDKGTTLCYDTISGRYFKSSYDKLKMAKNEINEKLLHEMYISLNEVYDELDLPHTKLGDDVGWCIDNGLLDISLYPLMADDGTPCIGLDYDRPPKSKYSSLY